MQKDRSTAPTLRIGSKSLIWKPDIREGKLSKSWAGPYTVIRRLSKDTYVLKDMETLRTYRRSIRHLRPIRVSDPEIDPVPEPECEKIQSDEKDFNDEFEHRTNFKFLPVDV